MQSMGMHHCGLLPPNDYIKALPQVMHSQQYGKERGKRSEEREIPSSTARNEERENAR
jgi:hypothetical protein